MFQNNQKVTILKNSINLIEFKFNSEKRLSIRTKLGIEDKIVICMVGDMSFAKILNLYLMFYQKFQIDKIMLSCLLAMA